MSKEVVVTADKIKRRKKAYLNTKIILGILLIILFIIFLILYFVFSVNRFTITLDSNLQKGNGIVLYENIEQQAPQRKLFAQTVDKMSDMSIDWLPRDIHSASNGGNHNGDNYIAYTFYLENKGLTTIDYWYQIIIDDVIKNVDEAIRIIVYLNDNERQVYAKLNNETNKNEDNTIPFSKPEENIAVLEERKGFNPNDIDKFTIVIFLEGDDPDCLNNLIGGEIKMHMEITEEMIDRENNYEKE